MSKKNRKPQAQKKRGPKGSIRFAMPPAGYRHRDEKKEAEKRACRGRVEW